MEKSFGCSNPINEVKHYKEANELLIDMMTITYLLHTERSIQATITRVRNKIERQLNQEESQTETSEWNTKA